MPKKSKAPEQGVRLLRTKLNIPRPHPDVVELPGLNERLEDGLNYKLILVSAPAGSGKTTLVSGWVRRCGVPAAWVSLDSRDNDPNRFWAYVITALQTVTPDLGVTALAMLQSPQPAPIEAAITELVNEIEAIQNDFLLVLDDYHLIETEKIHAAVSFLIENLPICLHLVIAGRSDPPLPLPLLRARRSLLEFKSADLRFSLEATATFLNQVMRLGLSAEDIAAIEMTTEGWAAGIQLAALSMQGVKDISGFIRSFSGRQRYIFDYLAEEVLNRQEEQIQELLLKTSILDRFCAELCDSLKGEGSTTGSASSAAFTLQYLERSNLFLVPLDDERKWYRYHHLFAEFLRSRLEQKESATVVSALHLQASRWYEANHLYNEAIQHAISSGDFDRAAELIFLSGSEIFDNSELISVLEWVKVFPQEAMQRNLGLAMLYVWALLANSSFDQVETQLQMIERELGVSVESGRNNRTLSPQKRGALAEVASIRANLAFHRMDINSVLTLSQQALSYITDDVEMGMFQTRMAIQGVTAFNMALAYEFSGELEQASEYFQKAIDYSEFENNIHLILFSSSHLAQLQVLAGHLHLAAQTYKEALKAERDPLARLSPISGLVHAGLGNIYYEWNDLAQAEVHLNKGIELGRIWKNWETLIPAYSGLARLKAALGDTDEALAALETLFSLAEDLHPQWGVAQVDAQRAGLWMRMDRREEVEHWANNFQTEDETPVAFARQAEFIQQTRSLLLLGRYSEVLRRVNRLQASGERILASFRLIEAETLRAAAFYGLGEPVAARSALRQAVSQAEPEGFQRMFLDLGDELRPVLRGLIQDLEAEGASQDKLHDYLKRFLEPAGVSPASMSQAEPGSRIIARKAVPVASYGVRLSQRELEVLRLMADGLTNQQIAETLVVSLNTVKTHVKNILACLEVQNRTQATARARELGIL